MNYSNKNTRIDKRFAQVTIPIFCLFLFFALRRCCNRKRRQREPTPIVRPNFHSLLRIVDYLSVLRVARFQLRYPTIAPRHRDICRFHDLNLMLAKPRFRWMIYPFLRRPMKNVGMKSISAKYSQSYEHWL